ncbi:MAG: molybdopterin molybdotransferase MoeA [Methanocorpusculum sp.]|uniref:molybdopterin molybdotransferase MoeA n=1 Tax=Methanocorpusculum sp. TaxID=2058474 RepID=UPI00271C5581|nr:gephyrin-like molybdotransferase Glp [Methanocorpusculum sp.]MDO9523288.1 molybdopterin molybdotransferase MoeA [Methanocorpusculum sp.]
MRFLKLVSVEEAEKTLLSLAKLLPTEHISLDNTSGRILAEPVCSPADIPGFNRSVKDGYAVRSIDTLGAGELRPNLLQIVGKIAMGENNSGSIGEKEAKYIPTGGVMPDGADAVIMQEQVELAGTTLLVKGAVNPGLDVLKYNEDFSKGEEVFSAGHIITAQTAGVLAAFGLDPVLVRKRPRVGIISTGNELITPANTPDIGQIRDTNTSLLRAFITENGAKPIFYGIVKDEADALQPVLAKAAAECDLVILSGGSSKDERDVTAGVIKTLGKVHVHGVSVSPGKPTIIGSIHNVPVLGLPGNPTSTYMIATLFVTPLLRKMTGANQKLRSIKAHISTSFPSEKGRVDLIRVKLLPNGDIEPVLGKSGLLNTLVKSDGYIKVPAGLDGYEPGEVVEVYLW